MPRDLRQPTLRGVLSARSGAPPATLGAVPPYPPGHRRRCSSPELAAATAPPGRRRSQRALAHAQPLLEGGSPRARQLRRKRTKTQRRGQRKLPLLKVNKAAPKLKRRCPRRTRASRGGARGGLEPHTEVPSAGCASLLLSSGFMAGKSSTSCKHR